MDIYVQKDSQRHGPFPEARIRQGIDAGEFDPGDLAWTKGKASWQPLSVLIDLDLDEPPPMIFVHSNPHPQFVAPAPFLRTANPPPLPVALQPTVPAKSPIADESFSPSPVPRVQTATHDRGSTTRGRRCKRCGAPYNVFSPSRAMGSGLCVDCTPKRDTYNTSDDSPITSKAQALKTVRHAGIFYILLSLFDLFMAVFVDPDVLVAAVIAFVGGIAIWKFHSRVAVIVVLTWMISAILYNILTWNVEALFGLGPLLVLFQIGVTFKATKAVFLLNKQFAGREENRELDEPLATFTTRRM